MQNPCVCTKCHTPVPKGALFCPNCGKPIKEDDKPQIGDYYYTDGTYSHDKVSNKTVAGIIVSTETTETEKSHGWTHGWIVATKFARHKVCRKDESGAFKLRQQKSILPTALLRYGPNCILPSPHKCFSQRNTQAMRNDRAAF